jgi:hypothetical protein
MHDNLWQKVTENLNTINDDREAEPFKTVARSTPVVPEEHLRINLNLSQGSEAEFLFISRSDAPGQILRPYRCMKPFCLFMMIYKESFANSFRVNRSVS